MAGKGEGDMLGQVFFAAIRLLPPRLLLVQCKKGKFVHRGGRIQTKRSQSSKVPQEQLLEEMPGEGGGVDQVEPGGVLHQGEPPVHATDESVS